MEEKITFKNSKGENLCGLLSITGKDKVAVLCHGHSTGKNNKTNQTIFSILNAQDISTFRFDFYGNGESDGKFEESNLSESIDNTLQAIKLVKNKGFKKIILVGSSFGGLSSIITASKSQDLYALVLKSPVSDYGEVYLNRYGETGMAEWKEKGQIFRDPKDNRGLKLNYSFVENYKKYNTYELAKQIKIPTLIIHGSADEMVPVSQSQKLVKILPNAKLVLIEGSDHRYKKDADFKQMIKLISDYIIQI